MMNVIELTDNELFIVRQALTRLVAEGIDNVESCEDVLTREYLQGCVNELKNIRIKFVKT